MKEFFSIQLGLYICTFFVFRIFYIYDFSYQININISFLRIVIVICIITFLIFNIILHFRSLHKEVEPSLIQKKIYMVLNKLLFKPLKSLASWLLSHKIIIFFVDNLSHGLLYKIKTNQAIVLTVLYFYMIPRCLFLLSLSIDIFYLQTMQLIFKNAFTFALPLVYLSILNLVTIYCKQTKTFLEKTYINVTYKNNMPTLTLKNNNNEKYFYSWEKFWNILHIVNNLKALQYSKPFIIFNIFYMELLLFCWFEFLSLTY